MAFDPYAQSVESGAELTNLRNDTRNAVARILGVTQMLGGELVQIRAALDQIDTPTSEKMREEIITALDGLQVALYTASGVELEDGVEMFLPQDWTPGYVKKALSVYDRALADKALCPADALDTLHSVAACLRSGDSKPTTQADQELAGRVLAAAPNGAGDHR